jgi:cyclopropane fatty-acyl-phospholipid synthase-like methyltransferase
VPDEDGTMAVAAEPPQARPTTAPAVTACYDVLDMCRACGIVDLTDGMYLDDRNDPSAYLEAQRRQAEYLLDQIDCRTGSRILDLGCGYGRILETATIRGARAAGITVSPPQVTACRIRGLEAHLCDYREIFHEGGHPDWEGTFDGIVANGSLEHFVQTEEAAAGLADGRYAELFEICRRLLRPGGKFVTTAIHFRSEGQVNPAQIAAGPDRLPKGSVSFHFANLHRSFGGWYPAPGQLERCAAGKFRLIAAEDGTHDYDFTSQYWMRRLRQALVTDPRAWWASLCTFWHRPREAWWMLKCLLWDQSWSFQFRPPAPFQLLRQTWQAV